MASIVDNYKQYMYEWNFYKMFDLIDKEELVKEEMAFIEMSLFTELLVHTNALAPTEDNKKVLLKIIRRINPDLKKEDNKTLRRNQSLVILDIYTRHWNAWVKQEKTLAIPYMLIAYINRIDLSYKAPILTRIFDKTPESMNNYKFKEKSFDKVMKLIFDFWKDAELSFEIEDIETKYEIVKTIISMMSFRGMRKEDIWED